MLVVHAVYVNIYPFGATQHQLQDNIIRAQRFIYLEEASINSVIVGSSLARHLKMELLPNMYNLSFGGYSILDGLKIVSQKIDMPGTIYIETNVILKGENNDFQTSINSPILFNLRRILPSLRDEFQPVSLLGYNIIKLKIKQLKISTIPANSIKTSKRDQALFLKMLNLQIEQYSIEPEINLLNENFQKLKGHIADFEKKGINIVFFEMPVNSKLMNLPKAIAIREFFYRTFPPIKYKYITVPENIKFKTRDGLHLGYEEAFNYTKYFKTKAI